MRMRGWSSERLVIVFALLLLRILRAGQTFIQPLPEALLEESRLTAPSTLVCYMRSFRARGHAQVCRMLLQVTGKSETRDEEEAEGEVWVTAVIPEESYRPSRSSVVAGR